MDIGSSGADLPVFFTAIGVGGSWALLAFLKLEGFDVLLFAVPSVVFVGRGCLLNIILPPFVYAAEPPELRWGCRLRPMPLPEPVEYEPAFQWRPPGKG